MYGTLFNITRPKTYKTDKSQDLTKINILNLQTIKVKLSKVQWQIYIRLLFF